MRFLACLAMLCCVTPALAGQQNERQPDPDEVTIRGCLHDPPANASTTKGTMSAPRHGITR